MIIYINIFGIYDLIANIARNIRFHYLNKQFTNVQSFIDFQTILQIVVEFIK